jgi:hypothetical protein
MIKRTTGVTIDGSGNVFVIDEETASIEKFSKSGEFIAKWGLGGFGEMPSQQSHGVSVDGAGNIFLLDAQTCRVQKYSQSGEFIGAWGFGAPEQTSGVCLEEDIPEPGVIGAGPGKPSIDAAPVAPAEPPAPVASPNPPAAVPDNAGDMSKDLGAVPAVTVEKGADAIQTVASGAASVATSVSDAVGKGAEGIRSAVTEGIAAPGDGLKAPVRPAETETVKKRPWWQFWK